MTARLPRGRAAKLRGQLAARDLAVLGSLYQLRLLTTSQVQRLYVFDGTPAGRTRRAQTILKRLHKFNLVVRLSRVVGGLRAGSSGFVYGLSGLGQAVLDVQNAHTRRRRRVWETKPYFQDHMLAVAELYVRLMEVERSGSADLLAFHAEPACWRHFTGSGGELVIVKPDAYARVGVGDLERSAFIEVDLATETLPTILQKCLRYVGYWRSGVEQQRYGVFPLVVWLVPSQQRLDRIRGAIGRLAVEAQDLFVVAEADDGAGLLTAPADGGTQP